MSYNISSKTTGKGESAVETKVYTVKCDEPGCKQHFDSTEGKGHAWQTVRAQGWFSDSAANHRCPDHKPARAARTPKADKASKAESKKASAVKAIAKQVTTKSGAKVTTGNRVAPKVAAPAPVAFSGGQSIGKKAKSAKK